MLRFAFKIRFCLDFFLINSLIILTYAQCKAYYDNYTFGRYAELRNFFPKVSNVEAGAWRTTSTEDYTRHPCKRSCVTGEKMTCYYYMIIHTDETMTPNCNSYMNPKNIFRVGNEEYIDTLKMTKSNNYLFNDCKYADGVQADVMVANGLLPGQPFEACVGDTIVADFINSMHECTTMHWHGVHQRNTPHMDGVPHVTQYPIEPGQAFRYRFEVDHAGTHWWHSHTTHQRAFGLAGALVVRQPKMEDSHASLYDFDNSEHIIMIQDWVYDHEETVPQNILINGLGRCKQARRRRPKRPTMYATFSVVQGGRYRFRTIFNGVTSCPISLSIDNHDLIVIASDGHDIEPVVVQKLTFHGGERFDFVLHANQPRTNYWIRIKGYSFCAIHQVHQEAILHYAGAPTTRLPQPITSYAYEPPNAVELNPIDGAPVGNPKHITIVETNALEKRLAPPLTPHRTIYTNMSVNEELGHFIFQVDAISFSMPKVSLLQTRNLDIAEHFFCNKSKLAAEGRNCLREHCQCTNVIQVPAFKNIEFVISSGSSSPHPVHLHGYTFRVVGMGVLGPERIKMIEEIDRRTPFPRRIHGAPLKDTVQVPGYGYTIIRLYSNNPGYWMFHCHVSIHSENGMVAVVRVGEDEQMKLCPVSNCGLCSSVL